jgi:hypothetical protein
LAGGGGGSPQIVGVCPGRQQTFSINWAAKRIDDTAEPGRRGFGQRFRCYQNCAASKAHAIKRIIGQAEGAFRFEADDLDQNRTALADLHRQARANRQQMQGTGNLHEQALDAGDASKHFSVKQIIDLVG